MSQLTEEEIEALLTLLDHNDLRLLKEDLGFNNYRILLNLQKKQVKQDLSE